MSGGAEEQRSPPLALVTGGCRRLGAHISGALAQAGYRLALHASHNAVPDAGLSRILSQTDAQWHGFTADFSEPQTATGLMQAVANHFGSVPDLVVSSAAIFGHNRLENVTESDLLRHYAVNSAAPVLLVQALAELAKGQEDQSDRVIVTILDQRLTNPHGDQLAYALSKQALAGFTQIAARELAGQGVRVNGVAPGLTLATGHYDAAQMERLAHMMPLRHLPAPADIAEAVLYLARARSVTGQIIAVDGGAHMESYARDFLHL
ncbi:MAG: SDR family oxidoreductase [Sphingobium sp.]|nr:SDR family oxidoreductase [Sphingobium sp.]